MPAMPPTAPRFHQQPPPPREPFSRSEKLLAAGFACLVLFSVLAYQKLEQICQDGNYVSESARERDNAEAEFQWLLSKQKQLQVADKKLQEADTWKRWIAHMEKDPNRSKEENEKIEAARQKIYQLNMDVLELTEGTSR